MEQDGKTTGGGLLPSPPRMSGVARCFDLNMVQCQALADIMKGKAFLLRTSRSGQLGVPY